MNVLDRDSLKPYNREEIHEDNHDGEDGNNEVDGEDGNDEVDGEDGNNTMRRLRV